MIIEHEHPLNHIDMWSKHINYEEESDEDDDDGEKDLVRKPDFECQCDICEETIYWYHRYYYNCDHCHYSIHKFCKDLPTTMKFHTSHIANTLSLSKVPIVMNLFCVICETFHDGFLFYYVSTRYNGRVPIKCATRYLRLNLIHHPSHMHPLASVASGKQILCKCEACGKEHKGLFYQCVDCPSSPLIHNDCVFLPKRLLIQQTTHDRFSHTHPLTLAYSCQKSYRSGSYTDPKCRVCNLYFDDKYIWIYECDKCRYYAHLDCATNTREPFMSILTFPGFFGETKLCHLCMYGYDWGAKFKCEVCNIHLHANCALLVSETITHKVDKHPMKLSYFPIENHKSDYFCEICELTLDPSRFFYHCQECVQSVHTDCAPAIYESEIYDVNIKFGGIHNLAHVHQHPLSFVRGIETDVHCDRCSRDVKYSMTLKCLQCKYAIHFNCFKYSM